MKSRSFFAAPIFKRNQEKTLEAITLNAALWTLSILLILILTGDYIGGKTPAIVFNLNLLFLALCFVARYTLHRGWLRWTSLGLLIYGAIHLTVIIALFGTIRTPISAAYILVVFFAGFQFGGRGIIGATAMVAIIFSALIVAENSHLLATPDLSVGFSQWVTYIALFGLTGNFMHIAIKIIRRSLDRARREVERRKRAEERLRLFSRAVKQNPASIMIVSKEGVIQEVNPKFLELSGFSKEETIGATPSIQRSGFHSQAFYKSLWSTILAGKEWRGVFKNKKKNGELYWEKASISPVFNEKKELTHFVAVKEDITEQKEAHKKQTATNRQLKEQIKKINTLQETLKKQALRDPLTGLHNRRYMDEMLIKEFARAKRGEYPLSIVLLDMDNLKEFNDNGGHITGDHALKTLASQLKIFTRQEDTVCRYGGDEFAVILPKTTGKDAFSRAQELRERMMDLTLLYRAEKTLQITFSAGIATFPTHGETVDEIFNFADVALYRAKLKGRNHVELFSLN